MPLDAYQSCPCGSGKKVKFCCSKHVVGELEKAISALEGEQRIAALECLNQILKKDPDLPAALALKATVQMQLGEMESAEKTVAQFLKVSPESPVAQSQSAIIEVIHQRSPGAIEKLQNALEHVGEEMPLTVYESIGAVVQLLLSTGNLLSARGHLLLQAALAVEEDHRPLTLLMQINGSQQTPLILKQDFFFSAAPEGAPWAEEFQALVDQANRGVWRKTCASFIELSEKAPSESALLKNIAILHGWLADPKAASAAWRAYAAAEKTLLDDAVEAEALAQLIDPDGLKKQLDLLVLAYPVADSEKMLEHLLSDHRTSQMPINPAQLADEGQPPPKALFWLLDRPLPETGVDITCDKAPNILGELYLFGKETDREARLEFHVVRSDDFKEKVDALKQLAGDLVGEAAKEEKVGSTPAESEALAWNWRLPDDTPVELRSKLIHQQREKIIFEQWPDQAIGSLDGRKPSEVSADPAYRIRLLAGILLLEAAGQQNQWSLDFNQLRSKLGLPTREQIDPSGLEISKISLIRLALLDAKKLSDDDLVLAYRRAAMTNAIKAIENLAEEVTLRDSLADKVDRVEAYELLARASQNPEKVNDCFNKAAEASIQQRGSASHALISELIYRLEHQDAPRAQQIVETLQAKHLAEQGVAQALYEVLMRFGLIAPGGGPMGPPPGADPALLGGGAQAPEPGGIWTPGGETQASGPKEEKPSIWVPGMD